MLELNASQLNKGLTMSDSITDHTASPSQRPAQEPWKGITVAFTGGGSAGHVTPNLALIEALKSKGGTAIYIGRGAEKKQGHYQPSVEQELTSSIEGLTFYEIPSERLRRYFDWRNFIMPFIVLKGIWRSYRHLQTLKPHLLFSKGGFVSLPVVLGAWLNRTPVVLHESDGSLGLANQLSLPFTKIVCVAQARARSTVKHPFVTHTGTPIRRSFYEASAQKAYEQFGLDQSRSLLLVFGGSLGAARINQVLRDCLDSLLNHYEIFHICGPGKVDATVSEKFQSRGYHQVEYVTEGFADLLHAAHLVIGRAGANSIAELILLKTPALLIPLPTMSSRGDQLLNAQEYESMGFGRYLKDEQLTAEALMQRLEDLEHNYNSFAEAMNQAPSADGAISTLIAMKQVVFATQNTQSNRP